MVLPFKMNILDICHRHIMSREDASQIVEQGDIFFFYRPKIGTEEVSSTEDVQRFYMVTALEEKDRKFRLFILGRKKLPEIVEGKSTSEERNWRSTLLPQIIRRTYTRSFSQLNMKQRQKAREELQQLRQLAKANTLL